MRDFVFNVENVRLGPCIVSFDGVDLGLTKGGVVINIKTTAEASNLIGVSPNYEQQITSTEVTVDCPLVETASTAILDKFIPWSKSGSFQDGAGINLRQYARELLVKPLDELECIRIVKAAPVFNASLNYSNDAERIVNMTFVALTASESDRTLLEFVNIPIN